MSQQPSRPGVDNNLPTNPGATEMASVDCSAHRGHTDQGVRGLFGDFVQGVWPPLTEGAVNDYDPIADVFDVVMGNDFHAATHSIRRHVAMSVPHDGPLRCLDL